MIDWKRELTIAWAVQSAIDGLDSRRIWEYRFPKVAAAEEDLARTEAALGFEMDPRYRRFLSFANGWPRFSGYVDLFGTDQLGGGPPMGHARAILGELGPALAASGVAAEDIFPIAVDVHDIDLFVMMKPNTPHTGQIIWFAGQEIERFPNFDEFFLAMIDYNRFEVERLRKGE